MSGIRRYYWERSYPYISFVVALIGLYCAKINFINNNNMNDAIDGINTITSLIIGFLGAILPVILGIKNESSFVKTVLESDNKLFLKYIRENILVGLILLLVSIVMYFRDEEVLLSHARTLFCMWVSIIVLFLLVTYRCLINMLDLIFTSDENTKLDLYKLSVIEQAEIEQIQNDFSSKSSNERAEKKIDDK